MKSLIKKGASIFKTEDNFGMTAGDFAKDEEALYILMQAGLEECGIPNASYLAYLHQVRVVGFAAYSAIRIWTKRMGFP